MTASTGFTAVIEQYLQHRAAQDELFAETLKKEKKNITDCITYIMNTVKKSGQSGFADEEIFDMAVHYYDEDEIEVGKPIGGKVVVNHHIAAPPKPTPTAADVQKRIVPADVHEHHIKVQLADAQKRIAKKPTKPANDNVLTLF